MSFKITGTAVYVDLYDGFWGIKSNDGKKYRAVNMPEQFKKEGAKLECRANKLEDESDMYMWGEIIRIVSFKTVAI